MRLQVSADIMPLTISRLHLLYLSIGCGDLFNGPGPIAQDLAQFQLVEEYSGMLMTGSEIDAHNSHASRDGIGGDKGFLQHLVL